MTPETEAFLDTVGQRALCNPPTLRNSYDLAARAIKAGIPGDFVECGVFAGSQCAAMARAILDARRSGFGPPRVIHAFDSFEGIPIAGPHDDVQPGDPKATDRSGDLRSSGISVCTGEQLLSNWEEWGLPRDMITPHTGWFQETVPRWSRLRSAPNREKRWEKVRHPIAVLRLDGDLYESTRVCLEALYPHVSSGGFVIIDDYALAGCRKAVEEYLRGVLGETGSAPQMYPVPGGGGPVWWRKP